MTTEKLTHFVRVSWSLKVKAEVRLRRKCCDPTSKSCGLKSKRIPVQSDSQNFSKPQEGQIPKLCHVMMIGCLLLIGICVFLNGYSSDNFNNSDCRINCMRFMLGEKVLIALVASVPAILGILAKDRKPILRKNVDRIED